MTSPEDSLFDTSGYKDTKTERLCIPENLGKALGVFMGATRYVRVSLPEGENKLFIPGDREETWVSPDYAQDSDYSVDFKNWEMVKETQRVFLGHLAGFPRISNTDQGTIDCLHIWGNNSDVLTDNHAIPLMAITGLFVYSKLRTELEAELDELAMQGEPRWEVPLLRNKQTGKICYRDASSDDIERMIKELDEAPVEVYGGFGDRPGMVILPSEKKLRTLLDS